MKFSSLYNRDNDSGGTKSNDNVARASGESKSLPSGRPSAPAKPSSFVCAETAEKTAAHAVYALLLDRVAQLLYASAGKQPLSLNSHDAVFCELMNVLSAGNPYLLVLTLKYPSVRPFLPYHIVNAVILACHLGMKLKLAEQDLKVLFFTTMLHDVGMTRVSHLANEPRALTTAEYEEIKTHVVYSMEVVKALLAENPWLMESVLQEIIYVHERIDGLGYPRGFTKEKIRTLGQIIAVTDTYEAMCHERPWRKPLLPQDVTRHIIKGSGTQFRPDIVKSVTETFTIFPPGSWVELSSGDIGHVMDTNAGYLTRPKVFITKSSTAGCSVIDLLGNPLLHIVRQLPYLERNDASPVAFKYPPAGAQQDV
ncbi:MAG: HD domain-containing phosphohydrolase [Elusimicrobiales bacterium]